jgi:hypothetical protein
VLKLNLDETAVRFFYKGQRGLTVMRGCKSKKGVNEFAQKAGIAEQKKSLMRVCIICDDAALQPKLPQLALASEHTLRVQDMAELDNVPETFTSNVEKVPGSTFQVWWSTYVYLATSYALMLQIGNLF